MVGRKLKFGISAILFLAALGSTSEALGSRTRAMGGAFIGLADDENAVFTNPAGLSQLTKTHYHLNALMNNRDEFKNDSFAFASQIYEAQERKRFSIEEYLENEFQFSKAVEKESRYNFAVAWEKDDKSVEFVRKILQDKNGASQLGSPVAAPIERDRVSLAFATKFPMAPNLFKKNEVYGGLHFNYENVERKLTRLSRSSTKEVFNVGISTLVKTPHNFSLGMVLDAVVSEKVTGTPGSTGSSADLSIGGSYRLDKDSVITADVTNVLGADRAPETQFRAGFERELIEDELALRLGSWDGTFTMGFGLKLFEEMKVDYSFFNGDVLKEHYLSTSIPF